MQAAVNNSIESEELYALCRHYKSTLEEIRQTKKRITTDNGKIDSLLADQGQTVFTYFSTSAQSDAMAQLYTLV